MLPNLVEIGSLWEVLPPGIHEASLDEVESRFAINDHRRRLFDGFRTALDALRLAGCRMIYLDGSFVTGKPKPADFDACWDTAGVDDSKLDPVLLDFLDRRRAQKQKYGGELFPSSALAAPGSVFIEFFQTDSHTGKRKGIVRIRL